MTTRSGVRYDPLSLHAYLMCFAAVGLSLEGFGRSLSAQTIPPPIVRTDTIWSGTVEIHNDVVIRGAEVRVQAGSTIRFVGSQPAAGPSIRLAGPLFASGRRARPSRLVLDGTSERPIVVETPAQNPPGDIEGVPRAAVVLEARHTIFRRIGSLASQQAGPPVFRSFRQFAAPKPAIAIQLVAPDNDLWLSECRFEECGPVWAEFAGPGATCEVAGCTFVGTRGPLAAGFVGPAAGVKVVRDNVTDAGLEIACPQILVRGNVLVGESAALIVRRSAAEAVSITGNYVHCTTRRDAGRYTVSCEAPAVSLTENVLVGGSYVVETAPRDIRRNVLIGVPNLAADLLAQPKETTLPGMATTTHALLTNIAPGAAVSGNLLLGPAYSSISVAGDANFQAKSNFFDGWGTARRALEFDPAAGRNAEVGFTGNIVAGYAQAPIVNDSARGPVLTPRDNVYVGVEGEIYHGFPGIQDLAPGDRRVDSIAALHLPQTANPCAPATQAAAEVDDLLTSRRKTVSEVHATWFEIYGRANR